MTATAISYATSSDIGEVVENLQSSTGLAVAALGSILTRASRVVDQYTGRRFYTSTADETKSFDGPRWVRDPYAPAPGLSYWYGSQRWMPNLDIVSITTLQLAVGTNDAANSIYTTIDSRDYFLEPTDRRDGWPALWIEMSDSPVGTYSTATFSWFSPGKNTIKVTGKFGWNTTSSTGVPDDIKECTIELAVRLWRARDAGYSDVVGIDQMGTAVVSRAIPASVRMILDNYRRINLT